MKVKKMIKLINNERTNSKIVSSKACDETSTDICHRDGYDFAQCSVYSYDECYKDYSACYNHAADVCEFIDNNAPCNGYHSDLT